MATSELAALEKEFGSAALNHPCIERSFRLSVWVPSEAVGKVIGSRGTVIQHIQRETGTRVVSLPAIGEKMWSPVVISGPPGGVILAYCLVTKITEEEDDVVAEFHCPFISLRQERYGQHGVYTKKLSADHAVRVLVPDLWGRDRDALMSLEGPVAAVWRALGDIVALFKSEEGRQRPEEGLGSIQPVEVQDERFERSFSYPVSVPAPIVGLLLSVRYTAINFIATVGKATYTFISSPKRSKEKDEENGSSTDAELIVFTVAGKNSHNVALAASFLLRVVQGERIKDVLVSVLSCQPQPTGSSGRGHSEAEGTGKGKPKFIDGSSLKSGAISKPADEKSTAVVPGPEQDEEEINAQLFSAPSDVASGGVPRRGGRSRGGRGRSSKGSGNRPSK